MLTELTDGERVVGVKQVRRALSSGRAKALFAARDADPDLVGPLTAQAEQSGLPVKWTDTMRTLGHACGLSVGAAVAAVV